MSHMSIIYSIVPKLPLLFPHARPALCSIRARLVHSGSLGSSEQPVAVSVGAIQTARTRSHPQVAALDPPPIHPTKPRTKTRTIHPQLCLEIDR